MRTVSKLAGVLMLTLVLLSSFTLDNPRKHLLKKWMLDKEWLSQKLDEQIAILAKENPEQAEELKAQKELMVTLLGAMTMEFKEDGTGITTSVQGEAEFEWSLSEDGKLLTLKEKGGEETGDAMPVQISESRLVLGEGDDSIVFVPFQEEETE
jgi:hypothetical protein